MYLENCIYKNEYPRNVKRFRDRKRHPRSYLRGKLTDNESKLIHGKHEKREEPTVFNAIETEGQTKKSAGWMPWH